MKSFDFYEMQKKASKNAWPEVLGHLELDEYEIRNFTVRCVRCGGKAITTAYMIKSDGEWKGYEREPICSDCRVIESLEKEGVHFKDFRNNRLTERNWFVPKGLEDATFKNYRTTNTVTKNALYHCVQYVKGFTEGNPSKKHNLMLIGGVGTGKSHLSFAMAKYLRNKNIGSVGFMTTGKLLSLIKETYKKGAVRTENEVISDIEALDFLVLDDLGAEAMDTNEFSWTKKTLFEIINSRLGKPTVYTTNFDDKTLVEVVGERITSRLQDNTKYINIFTEDYRKKFILN